MTKSILVTLTACSCSGKSFLFNYIRDVAKLPCLISTTTRLPRANEVHGLDYFFITEEESLQLDHEDKLAELAIYNGVRYGVTKQEFHSKLESGLAFLIVEPSGIDHYAKPAVDTGAHHYKVWVDAPMTVRIERFATRAVNDIVKSIIQHPAIENGLEKTLHTVLKRHESMLIEELGWYDEVRWDRSVDGRDSPEKNLRIILDDIAGLSL